MWIETIFENHLKTTVTLKEGHASVYSTIKLLGSGESHKQSYDMNATYREFLIVGPEDIYIVVSSDDMIENAVIKVVYTVDVQGVIVGWTLEKFKRLDKTRDSSKNADRNLHGPSKWLHKMNKLLAKSN